MTTSAEGDPSQLLLLSWAEEGVYIGFRSFGNCPMVRVEANMTYSLTDR